MTFSKIFQLLTFCFLISSGQVMFKLAAARLKVGTSGFLSLLGSPFFWAAIVDYSLCTLLWLWILRDLPLNKAYPFVSLSFVLVPLFGYLFLGEFYGIKNLIGSLLILAGIVLVSA